MTSPHYHGKSNHKQRN